MKIKIIKDFRSLKAGLEVDFKFIGFNLLVGANGAGKSSLLDLLCSHWKGHFMGRINDPQQYCEVSGLDEFDICLDYRTEHHNAKGAVMLDVEQWLKSGGFQAQRSSSGQAQGMQIFMAIQQIIKLAQLGKRILFVLDEPERSLDLQARYALPPLLFQLIKHKVHLVIATHCEALIENQLAAVNVLLPENDKIQRWKGAEYVQFCKENPLTY